ncbi:MerR family transcriptional regulator [Paludibacterium yongneupense]|uniref:MerR family transcriptional regulator n=1 Tax=Paludibacterium yongneupense TaxID=400061 RepID=UPI0003FE2BAE|nr:MerR family transcriptional regulator [Paludibacterium yongneupense]
MYTITQLARRFGLARSTLLYYDRIGLLPPSARNASDYRLYSEQDCARLETIRRYRQAGIRLEQIPALLRPGEAHTAKGILAIQLNELGQRIDQLRAQQAIVTRLLLSHDIPDTPQKIGKTELTALLLAAGLDDAQLEQLHALLEASNPALHQAFLESLGIEESDIRDIRANSRARGHDRT